MSTFQQKSPKLKEISLGNIGKIIITKQLQQIIDTLHANIKNLEWSGILFFKLKKGDIKDLKNLVFEANFFYPMDIGSSAHTSFTADAGIVEACDIYPEGLEEKTGLLHSHYSMGAWFSGEDMDELSERCPLYNYYLSLVVDTLGTYKCKVAIYSERESIIQSSISFKGKDGVPVIRKIKPQTITEKVMYVGDIEVVMNTPKVKLPWLQDRIKVLTPAKPVGNSYSSYTPRDYDYKKYTPTYPATTTRYDPFEFADTMGLSPYHITIAWVLGAFDKVEYPYTVGEAMLKALQLLKKETAPQELAPEWYIAFLEEDLGVCIDSYMKAGTTELEVITSMISTLKFIVQPDLVMFRELLVGMCEEYKAELTNVAIINE